MWSVGDHLHLCSSAMAACPGAALPSSCSSLDSSSSSSRIVAVSRFSIPFHRLSCPPPLHLSTPSPQIGSNFLGCFEARLLRSCFLRPFLSAKPRELAGLVRCAGEETDVGKRAALLNTEELASGGVSYVVSEGANGHVLNEAQASNGSLAGDGEEAVDSEEEGEAQDAEEETKGQAWDDAWIASAQETYGEVNKIIASRAIENRMFYQIEWKDGHEPSWVPATSIAKDVLSEYESPWWKAARTVDEQKLSELLADEGRDVDTVDENGRTALLFVAGMGSEKCVRLLVEAGADVDCQDVEGFTPLHIATGYVKQNVVSALVELGADPDVEDSKGRTPLKLAQELMERTPKANPLQFARRMALESILKLLESEVYENVEVEQILNKRPNVEGGVEYLVKWKDGYGEEWVPAESVADDLVQDYEAGLEYGIAEKILDRREENGQLEYLVKWADIDKPTWEPLENVAAELVAEYENLPIQEAEKMLQT